MILSREDSIILELPKVLYSSESVARAAEDFKEVSSFSQEESKQSFIFRFEKDDMETALEFSNYALGMQRIYGVNK